MSNYTHESKTMSNGVTLNVIRTTADNIAPATLNGQKNLAESGYYGINGGWFDFGTALMHNISACDGSVTGSDTSGHDGSQNFVGSACIGYNPTFKKCFMITTT